MGRGRRRAPLAASSDLYQNVDVRHPDGSLMFRTTYERAAWYLSKCLAAVISEDPLAIRLAFRPKGPGHANDPYFIQVFSNHCVVCGVSEKLSHHHIVPYGYRRYFPQESRKVGRWMYDVLLLCVPCHDRYERFAHELKEKIAKEYGVPASGTSTLTREDIDVMRACAALGRHGDLIPEEKRAPMRAAVEKRFGRSDFSSEELFELKSRVQRSVTYTPPGELIVPLIQDIDAFAVRWREHFLSTMKPKHLPQGWVADRRIYSEPDSFVAVGTGASSSG